MIAALIAAALISQAGPTKTPTSSPPAVDYEADEPPPRPYELEPGPQAVEQERDGMASQLLRTVGALLLVVLIIYVLGKVAMLRGYYAPGRGGGSLVQVIERIPLDGKNAVWVIKVGEKDSYLLGSGERGVTLLTRLEISPDKLVPQGRSFKSVLDLVGGLGKGSKPGDGGSNQDG